MARGYRARRYRGRYIPRVRGRYATYFRPTIRRRRPIRRRRRRAPAVAFKQRQVYISRDLTYHNKLLTAKYPNCIFKTFTRCNAYEVNAKTLSSAGTVGIGTWSDDLSVSTIFLPDDLDYIRKTWAYGQIQSLCVRVQLQEIVNGQLIITSPAAGYQNIATEELGGKMTPRIFAGLRGVNQPFPQGPSTLTDAAFLGQKPLWQNCPYTKTMVGNKVMAFYWNCPKPSRSNKHPTTDWGQSSAHDKLYEIIDAPVNQLPSMLIFFWADLLRYQFSLGPTDANSKLVYNTSYTMLIKLTDNHAFQTGTS